jgi:hypothetical protein
MRRWRPAPQADSPRCAEALARLSTPSPWPRTVDLEKQPLKWGRPGLEPATNGFVSGASRHASQEPVISQCCKVFGTSPIPKTSRAFRPFPVHTG